MKINFKSFKQGLKTFFNEQWFLLLILFLITIYPLFNVGITTWDDWNFFMNSKKMFDFESGFSMATINGRFYYAFMMWIYSLPYVIDSPVYFGFMHLFPIFTSLFLFTWLIDRIFHNRKFTLLIALFTCLFYQITPWCSMTAAHPFYYTFSLSLILVAFHFIYSYFKTSKYSYLLLASIIFAIATLFYESYLMLYIVIFIIIVARYKIKTLFISKNIKKLTLELLPFFVLGLLYLIAYFVFQHYYPSRYPGSTFSSELTGHDFFKSIIKLSRHAIPPLTFVDYKEWIFPSQTEFVKSSLKTYFSSLNDASFLSWMKGLIAVYFYVLLFFKFSTKLSYKQLVCIFLAGLAIMYVPHIPLALSTQFTETFFSAWVSTGISFFGVLLLFASIIFALNKLISFNEIFRKTVTLFLLIPLFIVTVFVQETNMGLTNDFKRSKLRMDAVDGLLDYYEIKNGEIYYLDNLHKSTSVFSGSKVPYDFWDKYFERKKGVHIKFYEKEYEKFYNDYSEKDTTVHLVFFEQSAQGSDMILSIVKCQGTQLTPKIEDIKTDAMDVGYYSANREFALSILSDVDCNVTINDCPIESHNRFHYTNIQSHKREPVSYFSIRGKNLLYHTLMIKNIPFENVDCISVAK
jgi:hypothetical protein